MFSIEKTIVIINGQIQFKLLKIHSFIITSPFLQKHFGCQQNPPPSFLVLPSKCTNYSFTHNIHIITKQNSYHYLHKYSCSSLTSLYERALYTNSSSISISCNLSKALMKQTQSNAEYPELI